MLARKLRTMDIKTRNLLEKFPTNVLLLSPFENDVKSPLKNSTREIKSRVTR
jgi:hypothetical protein